MLSWFDITLGIACAPILKGIFTGVVNFLCPELYEQAKANSVEAKIERLIELKEKELSKE